MSYREYFDIDPEYFPQVDKKIIGDFYVQNVFVSAAKSWEILKSMQLGIFTSLNWNPAAEDVNFTGGISLRM